MNDAFSKRWRALAVKRGVTLGALAHARQDDFRLVLAAAVASLDRDRVYREAEINEALTGWLADAGSMLATDHVELRRWLVDNGLLVRDGYGRAYERASSAEYAAIEAGISGLDLVTLGRDARSAHLRERTQRRAAFEAAQRNAR